MRLLIQPKESHTQLHASVGPSFVPLITSVSVQASPASLTLLLVAGMTLGLLLATVLIKIYGGY